MHTSPTKSNSPAETQPTPSAKSQPKRHSRQTEASAKPVEPPAELNAVVLPSNDRLAELEDQVRWQQSTTRGLESEVEDDLKANAAEAFAAVLAGESTTKKAEAIARLMLRVAVTPADITAVYDDVGLDIPPSLDRRSAKEADPPRGKSQQSKEGE